MPLERRDEEGYPDSVSQPAATETELKIPVPDLEPVRGRLAAAGARRIGPAELEQNLLLDTPDRRLTAAGTALRLRCSGGRWRLTHKGPVSYLGPVKAREELELEVADGETLELVFSRLGFVPLVRYEKERETWCLGEVEVALDRTAMGSFVEVEGPPAEIAGVALLVGLEPEHAVRGSYVSLWEQYRRDHPELDLPADMLWPPR